MSYTPIDYIRPETYDPDKVYGYNTDETSWGWWGLDEAIGLQLAHTGGGAYKNQLVVVGHNAVYYGAE